MSGSAIMSHAAALADGIFRRLEDNRTLATVVIFCVLTAFLAEDAFSRYQPIPRELDRASVNIAAGMLQTYRQAGPGAAKPSGAAANSAGTPGYPLVLFALAMADPAAEKALMCSFRKQLCAADASLRSLLVLQFLLAMIAAAVVFALAFRLSASWEVAALTLILTFFATRFGQYSASGHSLIWLSVFTYGFVLLAVETWLRRSLFSAFGTGLAGGGLSLFLPQALSAVLLVIFLLVCLSLHRRRAAWLVTATVVFAAAGLAAAGTLAWFAISISYDPGAAVRSISQGLSSRVAFHAMDFQTWLAGLVVPLPFIGSLLDDILPLSLTVPVGSSVGPGSFAFAGYRDIYPQTLAQPGTVFDQLFWLADTHVWKQLFSYIAVTPVIFLRGVWGATEFLGLIGIFHIGGMLAFQRANGRFDPLLIALIAIGTLFAANLLLTANSEWNNTSLAFVYAYAIAYVIDAYRRT